MALLRGYRLALRQRARELAVQDRPDAALAVWHVLRDVDAGLQYLIRLARQEPSHATHLQPDPPADLGRPAP